MSAETSQSDDEVVTFLRQVGLRDDGGLKGRIRVALQTASDELKGKLQAMVAKSRMTFGGQQVQHLDLGQALDLYIAVQLHAHQPGGND